MMAGSGGVSPADSMPFPRLSRAFARTPQAGRLVVALAALRIAEHLPGRTQELLRAPDG
jgi:hypothetical protein